MERPQNRYYEFDLFRIDLGERILFDKGKPVPLTPKVFEILVTLIERRGHTVEKKELMEHVWADSFVEEGNLNRNVSTLRKALGDDAHNPRFIKTVPKRGYRFDHDVRQIVEEDEELVVEKRTKYRVSLSQVTESRMSWTGSFKFLIAVLTVGVLLTGVAIWSAMTPSIEEKNGAVTKTEAIELYQKGLALWQNRSVDGLYNATRHFEEAIALDPNFALAHAALADAYVFDVLLWKKAEEQANEAIRLDPTLGQPHATLGFVRMYWEQKLDDAEPHFKKAIDLDPNYATARQWYALNLTARNQGGSGLAEMKRALELEPTSAAINSDMCQILYLARKYDQAIEHCQKAIDIEPKFLTARHQLYEIYTAKEMYGEAVTEFFRAQDLNMTSAAFPDQHEQLRRAYATGGIRQFWQKRVAMLEGGKTISSYELGKYYARLGRNDEALRAFEIAAERRDFDFLFFAVDPANRDLLRLSQSRELTALLSFQEP